MDKPVEPSRRLQFNFAMGLLHGVFFQAGLAFSSPTAVLPVFLSHFTGSLALIGLFSAVVTAGGVLPQLLVAHELRGMARGKPVLVAAIWVRAAAWGILGALTWLFSGSGSGFMLTALLLLLLMFSIAGGVANVPFNGIWGKTIPARLRGRFWAHRQLWGGLLAIGSSFAVKAVLASSIRFPRNYALLFLFSFILLVFAFIALSSVFEPPGEAQARREPFFVYLGQSVALFRRDRDFGWFALSQGATMFFQFAMPFYVLYGRDRLAMPTDAVGVLIAAQVGGTIVSNLLWGWLSDRFGNRSVIRLTALATFVMPVLALTAQQVGWNMLIGVFVLAGVVTSGSGIGFVNYVLEIAPEKDRPTYIGLSGSINGLLALLPILGGWVANVGSYRLSFIISAVAAAAAALVSLRLKCLRRAADGSAGS